MIEFLEKLSRGSDFMPHGYCFLWDIKLLWLHVGSDIVTGLAYYAIAGLLVYFIVKRRDIPFNWIFILFGLFIFACGSTHFMSAWTVYVPSYWEEGVIKTVNAAVSAATAMILFPLMPRILTLPSLKKALDENSQLNRELHLKVTDLKDEIRKREQTEEALRESESRYRSLYNENPSMFFTIDDQGKIVSVNQYGAEQLGYSVE